MLFSFAAAGLLIAVFIAAVVGSDWEHYDSIPAT